MVTLVGKVPVTPQPPPVRERLNETIHRLMDPPGGPTEENERRQADAELVARLARDGFTGPDYVQFAETLARYGYGLITAWVRTQKIFSECAKKGIRGISPPDPVANWSEDDAEDLAQDTVARALVVFRKKALVAGGWRPDGGASLRTYFVGTCLLVFPAVYRRRENERARRSATTAAVQAERLAEVPDPADDVVARQVVADRLNAVPDRRLRMVLGLAIAGYTHAEIAALLADGTTARGVEGMIYRYRKQQVARDQEVNRDDQ
jgi:DNA-directed RNA polymerase specialized sigma24 family protein